MGVLLGGAARAWITTRLKPYAGAWQHPTLEGKPTTDANTSKQAKCTRAAREPQRVK